MKLPKVLSKSRSSSANASPVSTPRAHDPSSPLSSSSSPRSPMPHNSSKVPNNKSYWQEKASSLQLRLTSLPRSRSRSKQEFMDEPSPSPVTVLRSPLGKSNSGGGNLIGSMQGADIPSMAESSKSSMIMQPDPKFVDEITHVFEKFDTNRDGKISAEELRGMLKLLGDDTSMEDAELMVAEVDADKDGSIDLQEFIDLNTRAYTGSGAAAGGGRGRPAAMGGDVTEELAAAFDMFDLNRDGCITADELHRVLGNLGNQTSTLEDCKRMIRGVDRKGYGHVDFDDFKVMMTANTTIMA